nr:acyl-CoA dehydrogenase family protein [Acidobacteriota bacterium]
MDFRPTEEQELLRRTVREFAETEMRPHVMEWDEAQHFPMELLPKLAALGLMGIQFDEAVGGSGMSAVDYCICIEELARVCPAIALSVAAHNGLCTAHIAMFGTDAQKQTYLPRLVAGEVLGAWGLTEASAGSDAAGMRTVAAKQADGSWILNGSKT